MYRRIRLTFVGMALAEVIQEAQEPSSETLDEEAIPRIRARHEVLRHKVSGLLADQEVPEAAITYEIYLNLRYQGSDTKLMILEPADGDWRKAFIEDHYREFAFVLPEERKILVDDVRIRGIGRSDENTKDNESLERELRERHYMPVDAKALSSETVSTSRLFSQSRADNSSGTYFSETVARKTPAFSPCKSSHVDH